MPSGLRVLAVLCVLSLVAGTGPGNAWVRGVLSYAAATCFFPTSALGYDI